MLQIRRDDHWYTIARDRAGASGRYAVRDRRRAPMSAPARVRVGSTHRRLGRMNVYRVAIASWYGPGLYGMRTGCGGTLNAGRLGVAHKTLPCGTKVTLRHNGHIVRVPVIDRGPYVGGREYDLTEATAQKLGFSGHGGILSTK
jgi:rare lipoprotein A (peptidoglycan hydrolase)